MKKTRYRPNLYSFFEFEALAGYLERMAAQGWMLKKADGIFWKYERIEPTALHFAVTYFPRASAFDPGPSEELKTLWDFCGRTGWKLSAQSAQMQIFYNDAPDPIPIETDAVLQLENMHRAAKRVLLPAMVTVLLLGLMNMGVFMYTLANDPIDVLSDSGRLLSGACWLLYLICGVTEPAAYFVQYRRVKLSAEREGRISPVKKSRLRPRTALLAADVILVLCLLAVAVKSQFLIFLLLLAVMTLVGLSVRWVTQLLKRRGVPAKVNFAVTVGLSFALSFACIWGIALAVISGSASGLISDKNAAGTYLHDGRVWEYYEDELPVTLEQITGQSRLGYSLQWDEQQTLLLGRFEARQRPRFDAPNYRELSNLEYTVVKVKAPFLYNICLRSLISDRDNRYAGRSPVGDIDYYVPDDGTPWGADFAYRLVSEEYGPRGIYLICYGDRIAELQLYDTELTDEQKVRIGRGLTSF